MEDVAVLLVTDVTYVTVLQYMLYYRVWYSHQRHSHEYVYGHIEIVALITNVSELHKIHNLRFPITSRAEISCTVRNKSYSHYVRGNIRTKKMFLFFFSLESKLLFYLLMVLFTLENHVT